MILLSIIIVRRNNKTTESKLKDVNVVFKQTYITLTYRLKNNKTKQKQKQKTKTNKNIIKDTYNTAFKQKSE